MKPNSCSGYEVFFRCLKSDTGYAEIVRWDGAVGNWHSLARRVGYEFGVENGDVIEATIIGNVIKGYINGVEMITATDDTYATWCAGSRLQLRRRRTPTSTTDSRISRSTPTTTEEAAPTHAPTAR